MFMKLLIECNDDLMKVSDIFCMDPDSLLKAVLDFSTLASDVIFDDCNNQLDCYKNLFMFIDSLFFLFRKCKITMI